MTWSRIPPCAGLSIVAGVSLLLVSCGQPASPPGSSPPSSGQPVPTSTSGVARASTSSDVALAGDVDEDAIRALEKMGTYLRTLKSFQIKSETSRDEVLVGGQKVEFDGVVDLLVQRPNRMRAEVTSDRQHRMFFYDGKSFTLWARRMNYYATVPAPATLGELADKLDEKYDLEVPLVDLFYWGSDRKNGSDIKAALNVGASQVEGVSCDHYAFHQDGVDWQIWIQEGDYPLPRKLVITTTTDDARPQYTSVLTWNLAPSYNDAAFIFQPPADARKITFAERSSGGGE